MFLKSGQSTSDLCNSSFDSHPYDTKTRMTSSLRKSSKPTVARVDTRGALFTDVAMSYLCVLANILNIEQNNITLVKLKYTFILIDVKITTVKNPIFYCLSLKMF